MKLIICAPDIFEGDAVGNHCLGLARLGARTGYEVEIYAERYGSASHRIENIEILFKRIRSEDLLLVSYSIFDPFLDKLMELPCRKICYFHGVTDPELLREFEPQTAELCALSASQFPKLTQFDHMIANSQHTAQVLSDYVEVHTIKIIPPVFADMPVFQCQQLYKEKFEPAYNLLSVGRGVPHKRIEDAISILANIRSREIEATLSVVGATPNLKYSTFLLKHARDLGVHKHVTFKGMLDESDLFDCYKNSSALISTSRHEGFCIPVLEAMHFGLPVFVRSGTAADEIANGVCIEFSDLRHSANDIIGILGSQLQYEQIARLGKTRANKILSITSDDIFERILH